MAMRSMYSGSRYLIRSSTRKAARWKMEQGWGVGICFMTDIRGVVYIVESFE